MNIKYTLRGSERFTRSILGCILILSILFIPLPPSLIALISLIAFYPLLTALLAIDPYYLLIDYLINHLTKHTVNKESKVLLPENPNVFV